MDLDDLVDDYRVVRSFSMSKNLSDLIDKISGERRLKSRIVEKALEDFFKKNFPKEYKDEFYKK